MRKRIVAGLLVLTAAFSLGGCVPAEIFEGNPLGAFLKVLSYFRASNSAVFKKPTAKAELPIQISGTIGGLDGTFSLTLAPYGTFTGTAEIGRDQRSAKLKAEDTDELKALVQSVLQDGIAQDVNVTEVKLTASGRQTTGGVKKSWNVKLKYKGVIAAGPDMGTSIKGTLKSKGSFE
jgi:hypothetical protein